MAKFMIFCFAFAFCQIFDVNGKPKRLNFYETVKDIETIERELKEVFMKNKRGSNDHGGNEVAETTDQPTTTFQITSTEDGNEDTSTERPGEGGNHSPTGPTTSAWQPSSAGSTADTGPTTGARGSTGPGSTDGAGPTSGARGSTGPGSTAGAKPTASARGSTGPGSTAYAGPTTGARRSTGPGSTAGAGPTTGAQPTNGAGSTGVESLGTAQERRDRPQKDEHKYGNGSGGQIQPWMRSLSKLSDELKTERKRSSKVKSLHKKVNILEKRLAHLKRQLDNIA